jgi:arylsulfatase A-like enzyme
LSQAQQDEIRLATALLYDAEARFLDDGLSALFAMLEDKGLLEDTLVVLIADHGEQLLEHDELEHGWSLFGEETLSFVAFQAPGLQPQTIAKSTTHADILPTLLNLLDLEVPATVTGSDAFQLSASRPVFAAMAGTHVGVSQSVDMGSDRLIFNWETGELSLFDLDADPAETQNRAPDEPELVDALMAMLQPQIDALAPLVDSLYGSD